jgi:hypothetical protein
MRTITTNIYTFNELNKEAKMNAIRGERYNIGNDACDRVNEEYQDCLEKIEKAFDLKFINYNVDDENYQFEYFMIFQKWESNEPKMLLRYLDDIWYHLYKGKYYSVGHTDSTGTYKFKSLRSKIFFDVDCTLTGTYTDVKIMNAMKKSYERVKANWTIEEFVRDMLNQFFTQWKEDLGMCFDDDFIEEELIEREYEFTENGDRYHE